MSASSLAIAGVGALVLAASVLAARGPAIPGWEQRVFRAVNGLPGWLFVPLWPVMQLGNLAVGTAAGLVVALVAGELPVAIGVAVAAALKLVAERVIRKRITSHLPARQRPGTSQPSAILRGDDVPSSGWSFPSGHAVLIAAITLVVAPVLPNGWELVPAALTLGVMVGRVFVGAHNPLDVVSGAGAGLMVGGLVVVPAATDLSRRPQALRNARLAPPSPRTVLGEPERQVTPNGAPPRTRARLPRAGLRRSPLELADPEEPVARLGGTRGVRVPVHPRRAPVGRQLPLEHGHVRDDVDGARSRSAHGRDVRQEHDRQGRVPADR